MNFDVVISTRSAKKIYRDNDKCVKVFDSEYSKADVLNEALNQARIEETGLNIPKILEVTTVDGNWAIAYEYISGKSLSELIRKIPRKKPSTSSSSLICKWRSTPRAVPFSVS